MRFRLRPVTLLTAVLLVAAAAPAAARQTPFRQALEAFAERIGADVEADGIGSIAVGVVVGDRVEWAHAFGWADRDRRVAANAQTIYRIGSISKSVTAVAMAMLAQSGVIGLEDPVVAWLPEFAALDGDPAAVRAITLRQLASHTAGLIREPALDGAATGPIDGWEAKIVASIPKTSLRTPPGQAYSYSNIGYGILGLTISRASAVPFMRLVEYDVFARIGMASSYFIVPPVAWPRVATGYANDGRGGIDAGLPAREHDGRGYKVPNGGVYSTVGDLARFIALLTGALGDDVLTPATRASLLAVHTPRDTPNGYGLGFQISTDADGNRFAGHGGSVAGYTAHLAFHPETRIGVVLLRNYNTGRTNLGAAARALLSHLVTLTAAAR